MNYPTSTKWAYRIQGPKSGKNNPHELTRIPVTPCIKPLKAKFIGVITLCITDRGPFCRRNCPFPPGTKYRKKPSFKICGTTRLPEASTAQAPTWNFHLPTFDVQNVSFHGGYQLLRDLEILDADHQPTNQPPIPPGSNLKKLSQRCDLRKSDQQGFDLKSPGEGIWKWCL